MIELLDFWPFNMTSGPQFLLFFMVLSFFGMWGAARLRDAVGDAVEAAGADDDYAGAYNVGAQRKRLTIGWLPLPDEQWAIAYLRNGVAGVQETLLAHAMADGVLRRRPRKGRSASRTRSVPSGSSRSSIARSQRRARASTRRTHERSRATPRRRSRRSSRTSSGSPG